jgi:rhodanese-related sulfurtransferase
MQRETPITLPGSMHKHRTPILLIAVIAFAASTAAETSQDTSVDRDASAMPGAIEIRDIAIAEVAQLISQDDSVVILDIRTPGEFSQGHIKGAMNIDYLAGDFATNLAALDRDKTYVIHCQSGNRSGRSLSQFRELGFQKVLHLDAGFTGWQKAGQPVQK